tara:strand:- start:105687 stop:106727 length:1041 start_codon:yes stop_codon:yes gene_type:complete
MKKLTSILILCASLIMLPFVSNAAPQPVTGDTGMPTIAVLNFTITHQVMQMYYQNVEYKDMHGKKKHGQHGTRYNESNTAKYKQEYDEATSSMTNSITNYLVQSHKFNVVERNKVQQVADELNFNDSQYVSPQNAVKIGHMLGADYLVMGSIENIDVRHEKDSNPYMQDGELMYHGALAINVQVVDTKSGQIVASYPVQVQKKLYPHSDKIMNKSLFLNQLKDKAAQQATNDILQAIFPLQIMQVQGKQVFINRGTGADFKVGSIMTVYKTGKALVDPDTGNSLGVTKSKIGTVKITQIQTKYSTASILTGDATQMQGAVVELTDKNPDTNKQPMSPGSSPKPIQW